MMDALKELRVLIFFILPDKRGLICGPDFQCTSPFKLMRIIVLKFQQLAKHNFNLNRSFFYYAKIIGALTMMS